MTQIPLTKDQVKRIAQQGIDYDEESGEPCVFYIDLTPEQVAAVRDERQGPWPPKIGETYWWNSSVGKQIRDTRHEQDIDFDARLVYGNVYPTEAAAKHAVDVTRALVAIARWQETERPFEPDWGDSNQQKHYLSVDRGDVVVITQWTSRPLNDRITFFATEQNALDCAAACPDAIKVLAGGESDGE